MVPSGTQKEALKSSCANARLRAGCDDGEVSQCISLSLTVIVTETWGYKTLPGDTRIIVGAGNAQFSYKTTLPGNYTKLVTGLFTVHFKDGDCSTPFFLCAYVLDDETQMTVQMEGFMSWGLKWINFFGADDLIPITVLFFVDEIWNELAAGSIQPQYSVPLIIGGKDLASVSFSCVVFSTNPKYELYLDNNKTLYYSNEKTPVTDKTLEFPQILNLDRSKGNAFKSLAAVFIS
ncbi:hypothetical protein ACTXT7_011965 [Hymenolepis weldensis]